MRPQPDSLALLAPILFSPRMPLGMGDAEVKGGCSRAPQACKCSDRVGTLRPPFSEQNTQVRGQIAELATAVFNTLPYSQSS